MNIFFTDKNPIQAARNLMDVHVVKMTLESLQLLYAFPIYTGFTGSYIEPTRIDYHEEIKLFRRKIRSCTKYKATHKNHPNLLWVQSNILPYIWLYCHFLALCEEYTFRYSKVHSCQNHSKNIVNMFLAWADLFTIVGTTDSVGINFLTNTGIEHTYFVNVFSRMRYPEFFSAEILWSYFEKIFDEKLSISTPLCVTNIYKYQAHYHESLRIHTVLQYRDEIVTKVYKGYYEYKSRTLSRAGWSKIPERKPEWIQEVKDSPKLRLFNDVSLEIVEEAPILGAEIDLYFETTIRTKNGKPFNTMSDNGQSFLTSHGYADVLMSSKEEREAILLQRRQNDARILRERALRDGVDFDGDVINHIQRAEDAVFFDLARPVVADIVNRQMNQPGFMRQILGE